MSCDCGIIGLGVMGSNLALNIAEKGFRVAVFNRTYAKTVEFLGTTPLAGRSLFGFEHYQDFVAALTKPRKVLILVQAGAATDATIKSLREHLEPNDIIVDTGNAHFKDQGRRAAELEAGGLRFLGMGISGGEEGARKGPAFFPGGTLSVWEEVRPIVEAAAAKADDGRPCVTMNGKGGAGSCVKMFHNAGEYAILQIWAEVFDVMRHGGMSNNDIAAELQAWKDKGFLTSYMLDITIEVAKAKLHSGNPLSDVVRDKIGSKGTGLWSAQEALEVGVPAPSLNAAVIARQMSMFKDERTQNASCGIRVLPPVSWSFIGADKEAFLCKLYHATKLAIIASYAQMFQCLRELDKVYGFGIHLPSTIATFRAGCILKGFLLTPMTKAFEANPNLSNLLCAFPEALRDGLQAYRDMLSEVTAKTSVSLPVLSASLVYINTMFSSVLMSAQVVSLQRDVFGRHGFERLDEPGSHSHQWPELQ